MMRFVTAHPNEYLVIGSSGKIINRGVGASALIWPGTPYVLLSSTQQESTFEITQESRDGIPLRFKGIVIYRITRPELTVQLFNFSNGEGHLEIQALISHICMGELRAIIASMTMSECIEQRKTTLTDTVASALQQVVQGMQERPGWGITLDVVQIAQVFIVDQELRRQLEAEIRNQIKRESDLSDLRMREELKRAQVASNRRLDQEQLETEKERNQIKREGDLSELQMREDLKRAQAASERRLKQEELENERERIAIARAKLGLQNEFEREEIESRKPIQLLSITTRQEIAQADLTLAQITNALHALEVERDMLLARAEQALRKDMLPIEQVPLIAEAAARVWQGTNLSIYGETTPVLATIEPLVDMLTRALRAPTLPTTEER